MTVARKCDATNAAGNPCRAAPLRDGERCRMHAPEQVGAVAEARRLGGLRRRREVATGNEYDLLAIRAPADVMRLLDIAASDTLVLENSPARTRALAYIANAAIRAITVTQFDERLSALERLGFESHGAG